MLVCNDFQLNVDTIWTVKSVISRPICSSFSTNGALKTLQVETDKTLLTAMTYVQLCSIEYSLFTACKKRCRLADTIKNSKVKYSMQCQLHR